MSELFRRLKPLYGKQLEHLWVAYQIASPDERREIDELLTILAITKQGMMLGDERLVLDAPPPALIGRGEFTIGMVSYPGLDPYPLRVARHELLRHVFILGPTGTGKSTLVLTLLLQVQAAGIPFMIFDFKRNYRCLVRAGEQVIVYTVGRNAAPLALNALTPPPNVAIEEWTAALSDIISTAYLLLQGARNVLNEALLQAHQQHGERASLAHAHHLLARTLDATKTGSRRYGWLESATRSLEELTKGAFGRALNATNPTTIAALLEQQVIFELHGFGDDQKRFFCLFFLQAILLLRKNATAHREVLQHVLVFDESHNVFPRERHGDVSVPARLAREVREYGEAIIAATQQADVSESLIANSGWKFILRCDYPKDVTFASQLLQIDARWMPKLPLGTGIARLPVRFYTPVLFTFGTQPLKNTIVPEQLVHERWARHHTATPTILAADTPTASVREVQLLRDVAAQPISTITQRYDRLAWNARLGNSVKDSLITKGLARFDAVPTPTAQVKILSLTSTGARVLAQSGINIPHARHGGAAHEYWKSVVRKHLEQHGFTVREEHPVGGGKTVDLYAERQERRVFIEVETGRSDIPANVAKCAALQGEIIFLFTTEEARTTHAPLIALALPAARILTTTTLNTLA